MQPSRRPTKSADGPGENQKPAPPCLSQLEDGDRGQHYPVSRRSET
jgi:hypothetical protein